MAQLETERLIIGEWQERDVAPFAAMNKDPRIMEHFPFELNEAESRALLELLCQRTQEYGFNYQPLVEKKSGEFVGTAGLAPVMFDAHFTPAVEISWRLAYDHWGKGYATEAAQTLLHYGFETLDLSEIVSFATLSNDKSFAVMKRLGFVYDCEFYHPGMQADDKHRQHALYRIRSPRSESKTS